MLTVKYLQRTLVKVSNTERITGPKLTISLLEKHELKFMFSTFWISTPPLFPKFRTTWLLRNLDSRFYKTTTYMYSIQFTSFLQNLGFIPKTNSFQRFLLTFVLPFVHARNWGCFGFSCFLCIYIFLLLTQLACGIFHFCTPPSLYPSMEHTFFTFFSFSLLLDVLLEPSFLWGWELLEIPA